MKPSPSVEVNISLDSQEITRIYGIQRIITAFNTPATYLYPEPDQSNPLLPILFIEAPL
jgi:hypothetical protein